MLLHPLISRHTAALSGAIAVPGDKSISHRALMLGAVAEGTTLVTGLLEGEDVLHTAAAMRLLGAQIITEAGVWRIEGVGMRGFAEPDAILDMGNSGTAARLMMGLLAARAMTVFFTGDASLVKRPMARVTAPLTQMGAQFATRSGGRLPLALTGTGMAKAITYRLPVASAQVKSAILLAGLNAEGITTVIEPEPTRDHTELMLRHMGADISTELQADGALAVSLTGRPHLKGQSIIVPGDPSSAAFPLVAALLRPGSALTITGVGMNPHRTGLYETLLEMGADISFANQRLQAGEPVADILVRGGNPLRGVTVPAARAPSMIDEYPILAMAAACAVGTTTMLGLKELRVKESDRLAMIANGLTACGVRLETGEETLTIHGTGTPPPGGAAIATAMDHRIAMSFLVLGMATAEPVGIDNGRFIETSFPGFIELMNGVGGRIQVVG